MILVRMALHLAAVRVADKVFCNEVLSRYNKKRRANHLDEEGNLLPRNVWRALTRASDTFGHINMGINEVRGVLQYRSQVKLSRRQLLIT
jgi:hypothetical protein